MLAAALLPLMLSAAAPTDAHFCRAHVEAATLLWTMHERGHDKSEVMAVFLEAADENMADADAALAQAYVIARALLVETGDHIFDDGPTLDALRPWAFTTCMERMAGHLPPCAPAADCAP